MPIFILSPYYLVAQLLKNLHAMQEMAQFDSRDRPLTPVSLDFHGGSDSKEFVCKQEDLSLISGLGRFPGEGNSYPLQYSCLENSMDREAWQARVHGVTKS